MELEELVNASTDSEKERIRIAIMKEILGFKPGHPVDFGTFLTDPYFLGGTPLGKGMYLKWREIHTGKDWGSGSFDKSEGTFPNEIEHKTTLILGGATGIGKTVAGSVASQLYVIYKFLSLKDPQETFELTFTHGIVNYVASLYKEKAIEDIVNPVHAYLYGDFDVPVFRDLYDSQDIKISWKPARWADDMLGDDSLIIHVNEVNFFPFFRAEEIVTKAFSRIENRFRRVKGYFPMIILDSSDTKNDSFTRTFIKESPFADPKSCKIVDYPAWEFKPNDFFHSERDPLFVYLGDGDTDPFLIRKEDLEKWREEQTSLLENHSKEADHPKEA